MKRAAIYMRVSTVDQHPESQLLDLETMAQQRGFEVVERYSDRITGTRARRPGLDQMMTDARRGQFDVVLVWASDRLARSVRHFLEVLDELNRLKIEFVSFREQIDTGGPLGRAVVVIIGAIAELERSLIVERVRAGMRRAKLEGRRLGRPPLMIDREALVRDRTWLCPSDPGQQSTAVYSIDQGTGRLTLALRAHQHVQITAPTSAPDPMVPGTPVRIPQTRWLS
jgi:DNA invertase Pin-like site-specific DNA recombinase